MTLSDSSNHATLLPVKDMDRAVKFYTETLGGKLIYRGEGDMEDFWAAVKVAKSDFWLVSPEQREKIELAYSVFMVKDIKSAVADLRKKGVRFQRAEVREEGTKIEGPISHDSAGSTAFFKDSEGNLLMLFQGM